MSVYKGDEDTALAHYLAKLQEIRNSEPVNPQVEHARPILGRGEQPGDPDVIDSISKAEKSMINKLFSSELVEMREEDIELLRADPGNPLHSIKSFKELNLDPDILKGIYEMRFRKPSAIQEKALPYLLAERTTNMIAQSQSGTGKTATFLLTILHKINRRLNFCQAIVMSPTRELAIQIATVGAQMAKYLHDVSFGLGVREAGDMISYNREGFVSNQIVIGTPGTLYNMFQDYRRNRINPDHVKILVFDEADVLLESGDFYDQSMRIKSKLKNGPQVLLFSATFDDDLTEFSEEVVSDPVIIRVRRNQLTLENIKQYYRFTPLTTEKYGFLIAIYRNFNVGQAIIFCSTRNEAHWLQQQLETDGHSVGVLTAALSVEERTKVINNFRDSYQRVLISTNVCSRGLDIPQVNLIINWSMPRDFRRRADCETYLHRIGRSGRFGKKGLAINFVSPEDEDVLNHIQSYFGISIPELSDSELQRIANF